MPPLPSRKSLEAMKRVDLQRICKDYGVRANLKSEALIDLLLDTQSTPAPEPQPVRRSVSTRTASKAGPSRISSMIVHDIVEDDDDVPPNDPAPPPEPPAVMPIRTRKAKELQTRLGVGKPVAAGGMGARAVTRSSGSSLSRGKRERSSRLIKPTESTIEEEPENTSAVSKATPLSHDPQKSLPVPTRGNNGERLDVRKLVDDATRSFQEQINALKLELGQIHSMQSEINDLRAQLAAVRKSQQDILPDTEILHETASQVDSLKEEIKQLKEDLFTKQQSPRPSTPKAQTSQSLGIGLPPPFRNGPTSGVNPDRTVKPGPGPSNNILGKRARSSREASVEEEEGRENEQSGETTKDDRPSKKKAKLLADDDQGDVVVDNQGQGSSSRPGPTFTVFRGSEEPLDFVGPAPPTDHLPDFFNIDATPPDSTSNSLGTTKPTLPTSSANGAENQPQAFGFSYLPASSTPNGMYMPIFPYPEPPQSPSPAGPSTGPFLGRHFDERTDIFKPFGLPSPLKPGRHYGSLQEDRGGYVNPAALSQTGTSGKQREISSNEVAAGLGLVTVRTTSSSDSVPADPPATKRTMYGTELESDTRFGDFGVEGVASGFWASRKY